LSQIAAPRDGGTLAMCIGPAPPPPCFPVNYALCLRSSPKDDVLSRLAMPFPEGIVPLPDGLRPLVLSQVASKTSVVLGPGQARRARAPPAECRDGGVVARPTDVGGLGLGIVVIRSFWRPQLLRMARVVRKLKRNRRAGVDARLRGEWWEEPKVCSYCGAPMESSGGYCSRFENTKASYVMHEDWHRRLWAKRCGDAATGGTKRII